jgi:GNAT superfamily N-acetyltransferase
MTLSDQRTAIRHLLDERQPGDALADYYAYYHPQQRTQLVIHPAGAGRADGYIGISRTAVDLFRPFVTMRLPLDDHSACWELITKALPPAASIILYAPAEYEPLLRAFFEIESEDRLQVLVLDRGRYEPIINVLVTQSEGSNGLPRFMIRSTQDRSQILTASSLNWQTDYFAELSVFTAPEQRRQGRGRSVVAAMCQHLLDNGRTPLYAVSESNLASRRLAESTGFVDLGIRRLLLQATRKEQPG